MKKMKSIVAILLTLILMLTSCGSIIDPIDTGSDSTSDSSQDTGNGKPSGSEGGKFSVSLSLDGQRFIPEETDINVEWTKMDGHGVHTAPLKNGVAEIDNLDGDYKVSLSKMPNGYVYNPNVQVATNDSKHLEIQLFKPNETKLMGDNDLYNCFTIKKDGVYYVNLESENDVIYYQYVPKQMGTYYIESWVNVTENNVNPKLDSYFGTTAAKFFNYTVNDGGEESYYTKNFKHSMDITSIGQGIFFAVKANSKSGEYPVSVTFSVYRDGDVPGGGSSTELALPMDNLVQQEGGKGVNYAIASPDKIQNGARVFDGSMWRLWSKDDGGDGYYHLYDEAKYPDTKGYGPTLYAFINVSSRFLDALTMVEAAGNNALTMYYKTEDGVRKVNYKMAIEGLPKLIIDQTVINANFPAPYMCVNNCPCYTSKSSPAYIIEEENLQMTYIGACPASCTQCSNDCRHLSDDAFELIKASYKPENNIRTVQTCRYDCLECAIQGGGCYGGCSCDCENKVNLPTQLLGYTSFTNSDGGYAVTEELKQFLQAFSIQQLLFFDGDGYAETNPTVSVHAKEEDQWLFDCYYYKEK